MNIFRDSTFYFLGTILNKIFPFILLPYITRNIGAEGFASLSYTQSLIAIFFVFINISQDVALSRYYYFYGKRGIIALQFTGFLLGCFFAVILSVIAFFLQLENILLVLLCGISQMMLGSCLSLYQCQKKVRSYFALSLLNSITSLLITVGLFELIKKGFEERLIALVLSNLIIVLLGLSKEWRRIKISIKKVTLFAKYIILFGFPLVIHNLTFVFKGNFDRLYLFGELDKSDVGVYSIALQLASVITVLMYSLNLAITPYYYENLKSGKLTKKIINNILICTIPLPFIILLISFFIPNSIFVFYLGKGFDNVKPYFIQFAFSYSLIVFYMVISPYLIYYKQVLKITVSNVVSLAIYIPSLVLLTKYLPDLIPLSTMLSNIVIFCIAYYYFLRHKI